MILVFGGTSDSLEIAKLLNKQKIEYLLSVTTNYGKELARKHANCVLEGKLNKEEMIQVIKQHQINEIIDATHPYALEVSKNIIEVAKKLQLPYIRYERPSLLEQVQGKGIYIVETIEEACEVAHGLGRNIFLATGSKMLEAFVRGLPDKRLVVRVLPTSEVILECEALGLTPDQIIGMKGPFSEEMNLALYKQYHIECMITKESGMEGGFLEKVEACQREGINVIVMKREGVAYPKVVHSIEDLGRLLLAK